MELSGAPYLYTLASLSVTFGGLAVIAIVLRQDSGGHLSETHVLLTRIFVELALLIAVLSMMPVLFFLFRLPEVTVWRFASAVAWLLIAAWSILYAIRRYAVSGQVLSAPVGISITAIFISSIGLLVNVFDLSNVPPAACYAAAPTGLLLVAWGNFIYRLEFFVRAS